jgi:glutaredoxin-related protein
MRKTLSTEKIHKGAQTAIADFHSDVVKEVEKAIAAHEWVIVGMRQNPVVKKARKILDARGVKYHYIEHGSYFGEWKKRLAIKLWSGWPTFPQVFHKGVLIGGAKDLESYTGNQ